MLSFLSWLEWFFGMYGGDDGGGSHPPGGGGDPGPPPCGDC